jgi:hypothetical protein
MGGVIRRNGVSWDLPSRVFELFFDDEVFEMLAKNTNEYAKARGAGDTIAKDWRPTTAAELKVFVGLVIYMGVFSSARERDYWTKDAEFPQHCIARFVRNKRFRSLRRFFHVSPPIKQRLPRKDCIKKLQPLSNILKQRYQQYCTPATPVAVDEMVVRFQGRSVHTSVIKGKPIPEGYKILALCERGYTYSFMYTSRVDSFSDLRMPEKPLESRSHGPPTTVGIQIAGVQTSGVQGVQSGPGNQTTSSVQSAPGNQTTPRVQSAPREQAAGVQARPSIGESPSLSKTSRAVLQMCLELPYQTRRFVLYCDNYFSNIPLFSVLRAYGIAACRTARSSSAKYPQALKINKRTKLAWGTL